MQPLSHFQSRAPDCDTLTDYDRSHLMTYARMLDVDGGDGRWRDASLAILGVDPSIDEAEARACWDSHLRRAQWIVGAGLGAAVEAFSRGG